LFKDVISIVEIYRKKHPELDQYIPSVDSTQREIKVRDASSEDPNLQYRFHSFILRSLMEIPDTE
jgi:hypothetical protein